MTDSSLGDLDRFDARGTYDAAALDYAAASERFWGFLSTRTIEQLDLPSGSRVLDVASGPGVSTIAAAERVGPEGEVVAFDSSRQMLRMVRERAESRGLENVRVELGDMAKLEFPSRSYDAVVSVLGIFFVPDIPALVSNLWSLLKPGGQLAITTLGEEAFAPAMELWKTSVREVRPDALLRYPWQRTDREEELRAVFDSAGVPQPEIRNEPNTVQIPTPDDWWLAVQGSGMRRTLLDLDDGTVRQVRRNCERRLSEDRVRSMEIPGLYALATRE